MLVSDPVTLRTYSLLKGGAVENCRQEVKSQQQTSRCQASLRVAAPCWPAASGVTSKRRSGGSRPRCRARKNRFLTRAECGAKEADGALSALC